MNVTKKQEQNVSFDQTKSKCVQLRPPENRQRSACSTDGRGATTLYRSSFFPIRLSPNASASEGAYVNGRSESLQSRALRYPPGISLDYGLGFTCSTLIC
ncbi:hypothetical protein GWI33_015836 [Rhynchophorus ferrugineus]|uniref:Uncharacterized protein n=1 Tax=Rhynchophorus ferrugineus TaxID=354439 RepID=A0A834I2Q6_RHYFE|nr:hypothetical protein GWI33_015836 [Rhynchophorus ferrugineus]